MTTTNWNDGWQRYFFFLLPFVADGQEIKEGAASSLVTMDQVQQGHGQHPDHRRADQASSRGEDSFEEARTEGRRRSLDDTRGEEH